MIYLKKEGKLLTPIGTDILPGNITGEYSPLINTWLGMCLLYVMLVKDLHILDTSKLMELLSARLDELQLRLAEKNLKEIDNCNKDIFELQKLIRLRNLDL